MKKLAPCLLLVLVFFLPSCLLVKAVKLPFKVVAGTVKYSVKAVGGVAKVTAKAFSGKKKIKLKKSGRSYYVKAKINKKHNIKLLLDTGATSVQIPTSVAKKMKINLEKAESIECTIADGSKVKARRIILKRLNVGGARVKNITAIIIENDSAETGLLGMSFLENYKFQIDTKKNLLILENQ